MYLRMMQRNSKQLLLQISFLILTRKLWSSIEINKINAKYAVDLKVANILAGVMSHATLYVSTWCFAPKDQLHLQCSEMRAIKNIKSNHAQWLSDGVKESPLENYPNGVHIN
ncbi:hypothetical protein QAD02_004075 [Eretmocerus hayati]|uniref:Uncharacterized protein n=1 Tax=Eretmocerus hayati TaxID=131215 RepID=A0ACC2NNP7_9HYME|nr:hypothetical protein QAD02_004075 [Eretmocerus hayati]